MSDNRVLAHKLTKINKNSSTLVFISKDKSKRRLPLNAAFFKDKKGRPLPHKKVIQHINDLKHDFMAEKVIIL